MAIEQEPPRPPLRSVDGAKPALPRGVRIYTAVELDALDLVDPPVLTRLGEVGVLPGSRTLIHGPPGCCKTFLALRSALQVAHSGKPVIVLQGEGSERTVRKRLRRLAKGMGYKTLALAGGEAMRIVIGGWPMVQSAGLWHRLVETKPTMILLDPLAAYFVGDENSSSDVSGFLRLLDAAPASGAALVVIHHDTKADADGKTRERGSGALRAWADSMLGLSRGTNANDVIVSHSKEREGELKPSLNVTWSFLSDAIECSSVETADDAPHMTMQARRITRLMGLLAECGPLTKRVVREKLGVSNTTLDKMIGPLVAAGKLRVREELQADAAGRMRDSIILQIQLGQGAGQTDSPADCPDVSPEPDAGTPTSGDAA